MRTNQVGITIERTGEQVPEGYPKPDMKLPVREGRGIRFEETPRTEYVHIYSDSGDLFEALSMAYAQAVNAIREWDRVPVMTEVRTNSGLVLTGEMLGRHFRDELQFEYTDWGERLVREQLGFVERSDEIMDVLTSSVDRVEARRRLISELSFTPHEADMVFRMDFSMFTKEAVAELRGEIADYERQ